MNKQAGVSLVEMLATLALASMLFLAAASYGLGFKANQEVLAGAQSIHAGMQLAKIEAIKRNTSVRFMVDTSMDELQIELLSGERLWTQNMLEFVTFKAPGGNDSFTIEDLGSSRHGVTFIRNGTATAGTGDVIVHNKGRYCKVSVFGAGGFENTCWDGSSWR